MKNFTIIAPAQLTDTTQYELVEADIYNDLKDDGGFSTHRIAMSMELEEGDGSQYPLEDILDQYFVHVEEFLESEDPKTMRLVFGGELDSIQNFRSIVGKRAYNAEYTDEDGDKRIKLIIE